MCHFVDCDILKSTAATRFETDKNGFSCTVTRDKRSLVFFSVPYDEGFSATVDGKSVEIEKANVGFMAIPVDAGTSIIRFSYHTPGLDTGIYVSLVSIIVFLIYFIIITIYQNRHPMKSEYPEGEKLLSRFKAEKLSSAISEQVDLNDLDDTEENKTLLDKLDIDIKDDNPQKDNPSDGFTINTDAFND